MNVSSRYLQRRPDEVNKESSALAPQHAAFLPAQKLGMHSAWAYKTTAAPARVKAEEPDNLLLTFLTVPIPALNKYTGRGFS